MKKMYVLLTIFITLGLASFTTNTFAQAASGPSDATSPPPTNATDVGKVLCAGTNISIIGPQDSTGVDYASYQWYKLDASGTKQLTSVTTRTYTETPTGPGYYTYELVTVNASGCTSPISDPFKIYVLPTLTATITTPNSTVCAGVGSTVLTANPTPATGYTYTYQWTRNGTNITGATTNTYAVSGENTPGTITFGVNIAYVLNSACTTTATDTITIAPVPTKPTIAAN